VEKVAGGKSLRDEVRDSIAAAATTNLADRLLAEFDELNKRYYLGDFRPSELSGGRFSEAAFRTCQQVCFGNHTPLGKKLANTDDLVRKLEQTPSSSADDTFRVHIPRSLRLIYDLRNKRDVAHLGTGVNPNFSDASLVLACASWVVSEIVRVCHRCDVNTAQSIVNSLVQRRTPLIWTEGDIVRVLNPSLSYKDKVLLILYHLQPEWVDDGRLFEWVEYSNASAFRKKVLSALHGEAMIHFKDGKAKILPPGSAYVEQELRKTEN
jgi:hypothetical protein